MKKMKFIVVDENGNEIKPTLKETASEILKTAKVKAKEAMAWAKEHKEEIGMASAFAAGIYGFAKKQRPTQYQQERHRIDHTYYDPSSGMHWQLTRPMTNQERGRLQQRKANGEEVYYILYSMGLIK